MTDGYWLGRLVARELMTAVDRRVSEFLEKVSTIVAEPRVEHEDVRGDADAKIPGVYVITTAEYVIVWVGRSNSIARRMNDHVGGNGDSDLPVMVRGAGDLPDDMHDYYVQYLRVDDRRYQHFLEGFLKAALNPVLSK